MFVTIVFNAQSVTVSSSEPLPKEILASIAGSHVLSRMKDRPLGTPVKFLAKYVRSKHGAGQEGPTHTFEIGDEVQ